MLSSHQVAIELPPGVPPEEFDRLADVVRVAGYDAVQFAKRFQAGTNAVIEQIRGKLTTHEFEVFESAIVEGMTTPEIAAARGESRRHVAQTMASIQRKLEADGREGLLRLLLLPRTAVH